MLRTIEKKKKELNDFSNNKTPQLRRPKTEKNDECSAQEQKTAKKKAQNTMEYKSVDQQVKKPKALAKQRSIIRGKMLYENAMATLQKQSIFNLFLFFSSMFIFCVEGQ